MLLSLIIDFLLKHWYSKGYKEESFHISIMSSFHHSYYTPYRELSIYLGYIFWAKISVTKITLGLCLFTEFTTFKIISNYIVIFLKCNYASFLTFLNIFYDIYYARLPSTTTRSTKITASIIICVYNRSQIFQNILI